jgi:hypothetical protein
MTRALMHSTRIAVHVLVDDDSGSVAALIMALVALVNLLVRLGGLIAGATQWVSDFTEAARFTSAVFTIAFKSLAFGFVGVRL